MTEDKRSYDRPTESIPTLDLSHHLADIAEVRRILENYGIKTTNTRIERYAQYLQRSLLDDAQWGAGEKIFKNSVGQPFRSQIDWHLYVLREVHELMWILKGLKIHMPVGADEKLRLIVKGRDFAALDQDSQSRDTQFELRIASYFCQSGCEVDMTTDTDVIARTDRHAFFVECKRVGSKSKLRARISEARGQLAQRMPSNAGDRSLLGCIAVDVTRVAFTHNGLTMGVTNEHSRDVIQKKLVQIATEANHLMSFESCKGLLCYWLQIHIPALIMNPLPATSTTRFSSYHIQRPSLNWKDEKTLATFYVLFESVSKGDVRALPSQILTPRQVINFPAGTTYSLQGNQVIEFLAKEIVSEEDQAEIIGTLTLSGTEHKFTFFEVSLIPNELIEKWRCEMSGDQAKGSLMLLAILYLRRYPYEES